LTSSLIGSVNSADQASDFFSSWLDDMTDGLARRTGGDDEVGQCTSVQKRAILSISPMSQSPTRSRGARADGASTAPQHSLFGSTLFDAGALQPVSGGPALLFDVCHVGVVLRTLLMAAAGVGVGALFADAGFRRLDDADGGRPRRRAARACWPGCSPACALKAPARAPAAAGAGAAATRASGAGPARSAGRWSH
jgi:hypothetical protein